MCNLHHCLSSTRPDANYCTKQLLERTEGSKWKWSHWYLLVIRTLPCLLSLGIFFLHSLWVILFKYTIIVYRAYIKPFGAPKQDLVGCLPHLLTVERHLFVFKLISRNSTHFAMGHRKKICFIANFLQFYTFCHVVERHVCSFKAHSCNSTHFVTTGILI